MRKILLFALSLTTTIIEGFRIDVGCISVSVRSHKRRQRCCPVCGRKGKFYDASANPRLWRAQDIATSMCYLQYRVARVRCPYHGVHVKSVPWARHKARRAKDFKDWVAWLCVYCAISAVSELTRVK
jgi:hypothetical protein